MQGFGPMARLTFLYFVLFGLLQTPSGNVEAKVMCFYRRRDISSSLILLADKHQSKFHRDL